ncbi:unnamed protein product [Hydatigera taeniaeformis]|uniref:Exonuclease domain-containing protein n=1 Tax=Hydatigena taeniaeformis TaxID=6205 RepID=A0A0R3WKI9_HYDTA|nr:unnamed protein product [Hydatigera taeniaeformis]
MDDNPSFPSYTPTPIRLLDASKERASELVYNPTPIDELDRYAPTNFSVAYAPVPSTLFAPEVPTYSPVVPARATESASRETFGYAPSQVALRNEAPNLECNSVHSYGTKRPSSAETAVDVAEKRKKILSLYSDLYEKPEEPLPPSHHRLTLPRSAPVGVLFMLVLISQQSLNVKSSPEPSETLPKTRPKQPLRPSNKIPMPIRKRYLEQFIEVCIRICASSPEAYAMALREEQACHDKAQNRHIYLHSVISCLKNLSSQPAYKPEPAALPAKHSEKPTVKKSHSSGKDLDEVVKGKVDAMFTDLQFLHMHFYYHHSKSRDVVVFMLPHCNSIYEVECLNNYERLRQSIGPVFYKELKPFLLTEEELVHNKFPRPDNSEGAPRGKAIIAVPDEKKNAVELYAFKKRLCCRCGKAYEVDEFGVAVTKAECVYHWGKPIRRRMPGSGFDLHYTCCQAESGQEGCQVAPKGHVNDTNKWCDLEGYLTTLPPALESLTDEPRVNVYSLDCEMVYTTGGCELARVTVIDTNLNVVIDRVVRPLNPIIDANTRFSGLSIEQLEASQLQITDVQMELLQLWDEDTILIGHSLESDLTALKASHLICVALAKGWIFSQIDAITLLCWQFIHSKVVDTSITFPHRRGPPYKRALRTIVSEYLEQIIQSDG